MSGQFREAQQFHEHLFPDATPGVLVMQIDRIFHAVGECLTCVQLAQRSPTDNLTLEFRDDDGMFFSMRREPLRAFICRAGHCLIRAGGVQHIMIVDRIDLHQIIGRECAEQRVGHWINGLRLQVWLVAEVHQSAGRCAGSG